MLYLRALIGGIATLPRGSVELRATLDADAARIGWPAMHARLAEVDAAAAARIHPNDAQRIQRALEVHAATASRSPRCRRRPVRRCNREFVSVAMIPADRRVCTRRSRSDSKHDGGRVARGSARLFARAT
jgi:tRNA dimethylallyltransferase